MSATRIIIVGAGLAGLALGQYLAQHNIPFHIYERDEATSLRSQGYRIRISEDGGKALQSLIPPNLFDLFEKTSSTVVQGGYRMDASTAEASQGGMPSPPGQSWNIDRATVRSILLSNLEDHISFGKHFTHYSVQTDGIEAFFSDAPSTKGTLLVGADGTRSPVRRQLLPDYRVLDTQGRAIFGKTPLASLSSLPSAIVTGGIGVIASPDQPATKLFCDTMRFDAHPDASVQPPNDYLYWVLLFQSTTPLRNVLQESLLNLSSEASATLATDLTANFHPSLQAIMTAQDRSAAASLRILMTQPPIQPHPTNPFVALVGDAAHPMAPVGGIGANMAWVDAAALAKAISSALSLGDAKGTMTDGDARMQKALAVYEEDWRNRSNAWLEKAAKGMGGLLGTPPVEQMEVVVW